jgi:hypothetical protein
MPSLLHSIQQRNFALTAGAQLAFNLPVNPLSFVLMTLRARDLTAVTSPRVALSALLGLITQIQVQFKGADLWNTNAVDAYVAAGALTRRLPKHNAPEFTATAYRYVTLLVPFTRFLYKPDECLPATRSGELRMIITPAASFAGFDTVSLQVETIELLDAQPKQFVKSTTLSRTNPATGFNDVDLPLGNPLIGATIFVTTVPVGTALSGSIIDAQLLVDNVQFTYASTMWETLQGLLSNRIPSPWEPWSHAHIENLAAAYAQGATTDLTAQARDIFRQYAFMDWDPIEAMPDTYLLQTEGRGRVIIRMNNGVADAVRIIPHELVALAPAA